jgi:hypothetical protein
MTMRFMILLKGDKNTEAGVLPGEKLLTEMGKYNEELVKAGVLLAAEGIQPSSKGARRWPQSRSDELASTPKPDGTIKVRFSKPTIRLPSFHQFPPPRKESPCPNSMST